MKQIQLKTLRKCNIKYLNTLQDTLLRLQNILKRRLSIEGNIAERFGNMEVNGLLVIADQIFSFPVTLLSIDDHGNERTSEIEKNV